MASIKQSIRRAAILGVAVVIYFTSATAPALAHAQLLVSNPRIGSTLTKAPTLIVLTFDDDLLALESGSQIVVLDPKKKPVSLGSTNVSGSVASVGLRRLTTFGKYTVSYRVISADGHPVSQSFPFYFQKKK
jgi:methionine-rich copper-binding protein CopC